MNITVNEYRCPQNHGCPVISHCPVDAISQEGYGLPQVDPEKCIGCMKCAKICPTFAFEVNE
jgi:Fe-S-cluster-containing hydrogenase component 2